MPFNRGLYGQSSSTDPCGQLPPSLLAVDDGNDRKSVFPPRNDGAKRSIFFKKAESESGGSCFGL